MSDIPLSDKAGNPVASSCKDAEHGLPAAPPRLEKKGRRVRVLLAILTATCVYCFLRFVSKHDSIRFPVRFPVFRETPYATSIHREAYPKLVQCLQEDDWSSPQVWHPDPTSPQLMPAPLFHSFATLDIPITSTDLASTILAYRSLNPGGSFKMVTSPHQAKDVITFNISSKHHDSASGLPTFKLNSTRICTITGRNRKGVQIFGPERPGFKVVENTRAREFDTTMILPESSDDSTPLSIFGFDLHSANGMKIIGNIGEKVFFKRVHLWGNNIKVESLSADNIQVWAMSGPIRGTFNATTGISLFTSNSPIWVDVNLNSTQTSGNYRVPPYFTAKTTNSPIKATISLFSGATGNNTHSFKVSAQTTNSPIDLGFKTAPLNSGLQVIVDTTNSPATVNAHSTYEGSFTLKTTVVEPEVNADPAVVDPSGNGRSRTFQYSNVSPGQISGKVFWGDSEEPIPRFPMPIPGKVITISTTNSPAILSL